MEIQEIGLLIFLGIFASIGIVHVTEIIERKIINKLINKLINRR